MTAVRSRPLLLRALDGEECERLPVWLYRQAGRFLPEYRELRKTCDFQTLCSDPGLAAEATLQPIRRFPLDASIVFSDLLVPLEGIGQTIRYGERGPVVEDPPRDPSRWAHLPRYEANDATTAPARTLEILARELPAHVTRIGFGGAPWTLAAYLLQGQGSKDFVAARAAALQHEREFRSLLDHLADAVCEYLVAQVEGGAQVLQIFDSWAGVLSPETLRRVALPSAKRLVASLRERLAPRRVPIVWFARGPWAAVQVLAECGADGAAVDFTVELEEAARELEPSIALQGNLDPSWLLAEPEAAAAAAKVVASTLMQRGRAVFNLGHGIVPDSRVETVGAVIEAAQSVRAPSLRAARHEEAKR